MGIGETASSERFFPPKRFGSASCDTSRMPSVADQLRRDTAERVQRLPVGRRIDLALALGEDDLRLYMQTSGKSRAAAVRDLRSQRAGGRTVSRSATGDR